MSKHMTQQERQIIATGLDSGHSLNSISKNVGKHLSTVSREILKHRKLTDSSAYGRIDNKCVNRLSCSIRNLCDPSCRRKCSTCGKCNRVCPSFIEEHCARLSKPPYVCNGCSDAQRCVLRKFFYRPDTAQAEYRDMLVNARTGFNLTDEELERIDALISPLIKNQLSLHNIIVNNRNVLSVSERTLYRLVDRSALKARNIDLPRKTKLKLRKGPKPQHKIDTQCRRNRTYADYELYISQHADLLPVEMDSVVGCVGSSKVLLTLRFVGDFMLMFLREANTAQSVIDIFNYLYTYLGHEDFCALFPVILTDNGSEFSNPQAIEYAPDGTRRTRIFYCDPMASYQKPHVERCHELVRRILPSGTSFDGLTQDDINLVASHVNSYARLSLSDKTPMDSLAFYYGDRLAEKLLRLVCQTRVSPNEVIMSPALLKR